jgi:hypothetical protein
MRRKFLALIFAPALALGLAAPAMANGPVMPPTIPDTETNRFYYDFWFGPTPEEWAPRGEIVADSGFRPAPNGFPFPNYGSSFDGYNKFFPMPTTPVSPVSPATMRSLYGDGVCVTVPGPTGDCPLTPAAAYLAEAIFQQAAGGHCFGFAATAAAIYTGLQSPQVVGASTLANQAVLNVDTQQVLARNWAAQWTVDRFSAPPADVVEALRESLTPGQLPFTLLIFGDNDGHAITPYAVYDRGNGLFDIAIYDNNFPGKERAIKVDTIANTWEYLVTTSPGQPEEPWSGDAQTLSMLLAENTQVLAVQPCIVCDGGSRNNLVTIDPTPPGAGELGVQLLDNDGQDLPDDRFNELSPLTPPIPGDATYSAYDVAPENGFRVGITGVGLTQQVPVTVRDHSERSSKVAADRTLPAGFGVAEVVLDQAGLLAFGASVPSRPRLSHSFSEGVRHYTVTALGGTPVAAENFRTMELKKASEHVVLGDLNSAGGTMTVTVTLNRGDTQRRYRAQTVRYPAGGNLIVDYSGWKRTTQRPAFGIDTNGDGKIDQPVRMKRVGR